MDSVYNFLADNYSIFLVASIFFFFVLVGSIITFLKNRKKDDPTLQPIDMEKVNEENSEKENLLVIDDNITPVELENTTDNNEVNTNEDDGVPSLEQFNVNSENMKVKISGYDEEERIINNTNNTTIVNNNVVAPSVTEPTITSNNSVSESSVSNINENVNTQNEPNVTIENLLVIEDNSNDSNVSNIPESKNKII